MAELKKSLGTLRLTFYDVGTIVGAGIYRVIGVAAVAAFLLLGDIKIVAGMSSLGALLVFILVNIALIVLCFKATG